MWSEVGVEEGEALQDAVHQALGRAVLLAASAGLWTEQGLRAAGCTHAAQHPTLVASLSVASPQGRGGHSSSALLNGQ